MEPNPTATDGRAPAFQFYPKDFLSDEHVALMSMQARGAYITLLCFCWNEGSLPADVAHLARLCAVSLAVMKRLWPTLAPCFRVDEQDSSRLIHPRLERERQKQAAFKDERAASGKRGAEKRWGPRPVPPLAVIPLQNAQRDAEPDGSAIGEPLAVNGSAIPRADSSAIFEPLAKNASSSSSASASPEESVLAGAKTLSRVRARVSMSPTGRPSGTNGDETPDGFMAFWEKFPKKVGKADALKAWLRIRPGPDLVTRITDAIAWQRRQDSWLREGGRFIPNPATWLNRGDWQNEPTDAPRLSARTLAIGRAAEEFLS